MFQGEHVLSMVTVHPDYLHSPSKATQNKNDATRRQCRDMITWSCRQIAHARLCSERLCWNLCMPNHGPAIRHFSYHPLQLISHLCYPPTCMCCKLALKYYWPLGLAAPLCNQHTDICQGLINVSILSVTHERLLGPGVSHFTPTNSNHVTTGNKSLNWTQNLLPYLKYTLTNIILN